MEWRESVPLNREESAYETSLHWVLAAELAKKLEVTPSVLANWRSRYSDFPPTKKSESGQFLYDRDAVNQWFNAREQGSFLGQGKVRIWNMFDSTRGHLEEGDLLLTGLAMLSMIKLGKKPFIDVCADRLFAKTQVGIGEVLLSVFDLWEYRGMDVETIWNKFAEVNLDDIPQWLDALDKLSTGRLSNYITSEPINELIVSLVKHSNIQVFDPAAGQGRTLLRVANDIGGEAVGQEINPQSREICILRAFLLDIPLNIQLGDSLSDDKFSAALYEVVVCDPPMNQKLPDQVRNKLWPFGRPGFTADWIWTQHLAMHLSKTGEGYLSLSSGALYNRQSSEIRREMIRRGCIEAVISLPPLATSARIPLALLCLRAPDIKLGAPVLMIDASDFDVRRVDEFVSNIPDLVKRIGEFRENPNSFVPDESSTIVSILDLLEGDCTLVPAQYIARSKKAEFPYKGDLGVLLQDLRQSAHKMGLNLPEVTSSEIEMNHVPLKTLRLGEMAYVISGVRVEAEIFFFEPGEKVSLETTQSVLTVKALRAAGPLASSEFMSEAKLNDRAITKPGDIVFTRIGESKAKVDANGGNLILSPLSILRLDSRFDPYVVAAALNSDHVRKLTTGSVIGRLDLDMLEIPQIPIGQAKFLRAALIEVERLEGNVESLRNLVIKWNTIGGEYLATASGVIL
jgi:hypothetical protein